MKKLFLILALMCFAVNDLMAQQTIDRRVLPTQVAFEDEANTWTLTQTFNGPVIIGGVGSFSINGSTSGTISFLRAAATGTYNWYYPTSAGTAGQPLLSGGGSVPMTFGTLGLAAGGTNRSTAWTADRCVRVNTAGTALEPAAADCGVGGGGTILTNSASLATALTDETGTGLSVFNNSPTLLTPTIASLTNAQHNHTNAAGGGLLGINAINTTDVTAFARSLLDDADAATARTTLGISGLGATAVFSDQSNTYTTGDQNFAGAASLTPPNATGAAPTTNFRIAGNTSTSRLVYGVGGSTFVIAHTGEIQPLSTGLTQLSNLSPVNNSMIVHNGTIWTMATRPSCSGANQAINFDATTHAEGCVTIATGGIAGTSGRIAKINPGGVTAGDSIMSEAAGVVTVAGGLVVGSGPSLVWNTLAITVDRTWIIQDVGGTILPAAAAGTFTNNNILKASVTGGIVTIVDGGAAGTGTSTDSNAKTYTNLTLDAEATGNVITLPYEWDLDLVGCVGGTASHIWNDDPLSSSPTATCITGTNRTTGVATFPDSDGAFGKQITKALPTGFTGTLDAVIWWKTTGTGNARFQIQTKCYADDEADDAAFNTASIVTAAAGTSGRPNRQAMTSIDITGCAANELMRIRFFRNRTEASDTLNSTLDVEKVIFTYRVAR